MASSRLSGQKSPGLWARIKRLALSDVGALVRGLNAADLEAFEQLLIEADFGVPATLDLVEGLETEIRRGRLKTETDLRDSLRASIEALLTTDGAPTEIRSAPPDEITVVLMVGVNGVGKTTTAAKLAHLLVGSGRRVLLAGADTYRAGAIAQLETWAARLDLPCVSGAPGGDPAAVVFDAIQAARARERDTVLVDTAGRLHTQEGLMEELRKVVRVAARQARGAPHEVLLVLDGTVGQNAVAQGRQFAEAVSPTGIIVTKLDGTARGGAVVALRRELALPIRYLGTGERLDDLHPFQADAFARHLLSDEPG